MTICLGGDQMEYQPGCSFCDELTNSGENSFFDIFAKIEFAKADLDNRIVAETENFVLMPMVGPLVPMYLLLVSKKHFLSFAHMPVYMLAEAEGIMKKLFAVFSEIACKPVFFEHGPMSAKERGACCSDHAYIHSVAIEADITNDFEEREFVKRKILNLSEIKSQLLFNCPYLFYQNQAGEMYLADAPGVESQFIRKMLAVKIGAFSRIEWIDSRRTDWMIEVVKKIKPYFQK